MDDGAKPSWLPSWLPEHGTLKYGATALQLLILGLAVGFLLFHLASRDTSTALGILGNQGT